METLAQKMIEVHYGKPVNHSAGTLDDAHELLYASLVDAGQIESPAS
jgi:hypothetical protein